MDINAKIRARRARRFAKQRNDVEAQAKRAARGRFNDAIASGLSVAEAVDFANGNKAPANAAKPAPEPVSVPGDWHKLHWRKQVKLAEQVSGESIEINAGAKARAAEILEAAQ
jgi:hypothetical protein